jgi:hypothetical protein
MRQMTTIVGLGLLCVGTIFAQPALAETKPAEPGLLNDRFMVSLGTFLLNTETKVSVNGSSGATGTVIDLNKDLGLKDANRFRFDATWRFKPHHKLRAMYFDTSQSSTRTLSSSITIRDTVYPVNAAVTAKTSTTIAELAYEYVFLKRETFELSATGGIHSVKFKLELSGNGNIGAQTGQFRTEGAATTAPLPVLGVRGLWQFAPKWYLDGQGQFFALKIDNYDGHLTDFRVGIVRMFGQRFGLGAGWNEFSTKLGVSKRDFNGDLKWSYGGAQLFVMASF